MDKIDAPETVEKIREPASQEAIDKLLQACDSQDYSGKMKVLLLILVDTGARVFEATEIKLADINLEEAETQLFGKARPRHGPRPRTVPISPVTVKALREYIRNALYPQVNQVSWRQRQLFEPPTYSLQSHFDRTQI